MKDSTLALTPKGDVATIQTATVDVSVIRIGKRQLTQSVFRQLPKGSFFEILDEDSPESFEKKPLEIFFNQNVWGKVVYYFDHYKDRLDGFHLVFSKDGKLYRQWVDKDGIELPFKTDLYAPLGTYYSITSLKGIYNFNNGEISSRDWSGEKNIAGYYDSCFSDVADHHIKDEFYSLYCRVMHAVRNMKLEQLFIAT
jgi:hypothetical protein